MSADSATARVEAPGPTEDDVLALRQLATAIYRRYATTYASARDFAVQELVARVKEENLMEVAVTEMAGLLLDQCKRTSNVAPYTRAAKREDERVSASVEPMRAQPRLTESATVVTGDSEGSGLPRICRLSEYRELLGVRLWNRKRVRDATRADLLEQCTRLESQAGTNLDRARRLRALADIMQPGETALTALRRAESEGLEIPSWSKSTSTAS